MTITTSSENTSSIVPHVYTVPPWEDAAAVTAAAAVPEGDGLTFHAVLAVEGVMTSDARLLTVDGARWRTPPIPLMLMTESSHGGQAGGAEIAGRIENIEIVDRRVMASGTIVTGIPGGEMAATLVESWTLRFVSIDVGDADVTTMVDEDGDMVSVFADYEIMGATIVPFSAFVGEAVIWLDGMDMPSEATDELPEMPTLSEITDEDVGGLLEALLSDGRAVLASAGWRDAPPPAEWFEEPDQADGFVNVDGGRVWGRFYTRGQCHLGSPRGQCLQVGPSRHEYGYFQGQGAGIECDDGTRVFPGPLVLHKDHAPTSNGWDAGRAQRYYSDTGTQVAAIVCGDHYDRGRYEFSWYSGALHPTITDAELRILGCSKLSGDWRPVNGNLELVGLMAVNTPGYPQLRARVASGMPLAVVASVGHGGVEPCHDCGGYYAADAKPDVQPHEYVPSDGAGSPCEVCGGPPGGAAHTMAAMLTEFRRMNRIVETALREQAIAVLEAEVRQA